MNDRIQYLLSQYESNNCSREEMEELFYYIYNSRDNDNALKKLVHQVYEDIRKNHPSFTYVDKQGKLISTDPEELHVLTGQPNFDRQVLKKYTRFVILGGVIIISILAGIGIKRFSDINAAEDESMNTLTKKFSQRSEQKSFILTDSTQVWLNASSSIEFPDKFSGNSREVFLKGEAFFKIRQVPGKPFVIHAGKVTARSIGATSCNFKAYKDENESIISVSQGRISVERADKPVAELTVGREAKIGKMDRSVLQKNIEVGKIAAWQWGELIYDEVMLTDLVADLERVYNAKITITDQEKERQKISLAFRREIGVEEALKRVSSLAHAQLNASDNEYFIESLP